MNARDRERLDWALSNLGFEKDVDWQWQNLPDGSLMWRTEVKEALVDFIKNAVSTGDCAAVINLFSPPPEHEQQQK